MSELEGKDINEVISEGMGKLASMPSGTYLPAYPHTHTHTAYTGGAVAVSGGAAAASGGDAPVEEKKEEKKEESEDESDDDMGFGLFD